MTEAIYSTDNYDLFIGKDRVATMNGVMDGDDTYLVVNKTTGVVEARVPLLPNAKKLMHELEMLEEHLDGYIDNLRQGVSKVQAASAGVLNQIPNVKRIN